MGVEGDGAAGAARRAEQRHVAQELLRATTAIQRTLSPRDDCGAAHLVVVADGGQRVDAALAVHDQAVVEEAGRVALRLVLLQHRRRGAGAALLELPCWSLAKLFTMALHKLW